MEHTTAVNVREEAGAFPLPVPPTRHALLAKVYLGLLVRFAMAAGVFFLGQGWLDDSKDRLVFLCVVVAVALWRLGVGPWLSWLSGLQRANTLQLETLEALAQHDAEVRLYLRRIFGLGRPILHADLTAVLERTEQIKTAAQTKATTERDRAVQARIQALVSAPDRPTPARSAPGQEA